MGLKNNRAAEPATAERALVIAIAPDPSQHFDLVRRIEGSANLMLVPDVGAALTTLERIQASWVDESTVSALPCGLVIDDRRQKVTWHGEELQLTTYEHRLLKIMATDPDRVWTHEHLHLAVWKTRFLVGASDLYSSVKRLRRKLESSGVSLRIESVRGVGFRLVPTLTPEPAVD
jgi:two-component system, OmpR family, response regulator MtrA